MRVALLRVAVFVVCIIMCVNFCHAQASTPTPVPQLLTTQSQSSPGPYTILDLGSLGGGTSFGNAINNFGQVAGFSVTSQGFQHAFRTAPNSVINSTTDDLGTLGGSDSQANGINNSGQVVGFAITEAGTQHAFRTAPNSVINSTTDDLGTLGGTNSFAKAINDLGLVVGYSERADGTTHAFAWSVTTGLNDLGTFGGPTSEADSINNAGQIVGGADLPVGPGTFHAFRINFGSIITPAANSSCFFGSCSPDDLGTLGGGHGQAFGINGSGQATGVSEIPDTGIPPQRAFLTAPNALIDPARDNLGSLPPGFITFGRAVNSSGQVVGEALLNDGGDSHAFIFDHGLLVDLNSLIPPGSGWILIQANGINDSGQITGFGRHNGTPRAFLLSPVISQLGTITVTTNVTASKFTLSGAAGNTIQGSGVSFSQSATPDLYTIIFSPVPGFITPASSSQNLVAGGSIHFEGLYISMPPFLTVSSNTLDFGRQIIGTESSLKTVTLQNSGGGLLVPSISISGDYSEADDCGQGLNTGSICHVNITFTPRGPATRNGLISISTNANSGQVELFGSGTLGFPLKGLAAGSDVGLTAATARINSVFDHSMQDLNGYHIYGCDKNVTDFVGEIAEKEPSVEVFHCNKGYSQGGSPFVVNGHYTGGTTLFYDGHPGYDYRSAFGNDVYAAISGTIKYPTQSELTANHVTVGGDPDDLNVLELDSAEGLKLFYLHLSTHPRSISMHLTAALSSQDFIGRQDSRFTRDVTPTSPVNLNGNFSITGNVTVVGPAPTSPGAVQLLGTTLKGGCVAIVVNLDNAGNYRFAGLPEGFYNIRVIKSGYAFSPTSPRTIVQEGFIQAGMKIAESGNAGKCFAPHLHFEVQRHTSVPIMDHTSANSKKNPVLDFIPVDPYGWHPCNINTADPYFLIPDLSNSGLINEDLWDVRLPSTTCPTTP
jgi:probable HAF family extracellular repeat protein